MKIRKKLAKPHTESELDSAIEGCKGCKKFKGGYSKQVSSYHGLRVTVTYEPRAVCELSSSGERSPNQEVGGYINCRRYVQYQAVEDKKKKVPEAGDRRFSLWPRQVGTGYKA